MRLNKRLVELGVCSRRKADEMIIQNKILVNGHIATLGEQVDENDEIIVSGKLINQDEKKIIIAYNKPKGVICTESKVEKNTKISDKIKEFGLSKRVFTIGRLDKDTTGLIILTNDGALANEITNKHKGYEKEYEVVVDKEINDDFIKKMTEGVYLSELDKTTLKCKIIKSKTNNKFNIIIREGLNRQIRRMCRELSYRVISLKRVRIIKLKIGNLKEGEYKFINKSEIGL